MAQQSRNVLKNFFKNGNLLSQSEFSDLIDSTWNINDDGIGKTSQEGLQLAPGASSRKVISIYEGGMGSAPNWQIAINASQNKGLSIVQPGHEAQPALFVGDEGKVGIATATPMTHLEVNGSMGSKHRVGTYKVGKVRADAEWHTLLSGLQGNNAFEIVAEARGNDGDGNYAMAHAIALNAFQGRRGKIKVINASFRWYDFRNRILLRWLGTPYDYTLQMRTGTHYFLNKDTKEYNHIRFHICRLWDDQLHFETLVDHA
ncbi:MAG TPA: hypothetical protein VL947_09175 [Cytophagales bacterium]|nr:hypothetical protein [Cytophagales bacterium]